MSNSYPLYVILWSILFGGFSLNQLCASSENLSALVTISCEYLGPDTIYVDSSCTAPLTWDEANNPQCETSSAGGVIITRTLYAISGGYDFGDLVPGGTEVEVTYRVTDNMGNIEFFTFSIFFADTIAPVFDTSSLPADTAMLNSHELPPADVTAIDNCDTTGADIEITFEDSPIPDLCLGGDWTRTYIATDAFGNQTTYEQTITQLPDTTSPVFLTLPTDTLVNCEDLPEAYTEWLNTQYQQIEVENPGGTSVTLSDDGPAPEDLIGFCGDLTIVFTAEDSCENAATAAAVFTVFDTIQPTISEPAAPLMIDCNLHNGDSLLQDWIANHGFAEGADNCSKISWEMIPAVNSNDFLCNDTLAVIWRASDSCGNTSDTETYVFISDTIPPIFETTPLDTAISCKENSIEIALLNWLDNRGGAVLSDQCWNSTGIEMTFTHNGETIEASEVFSLLETSIGEGCESVELNTGVVVENALGVVEIGFVATDFCQNQRTETAHFVVIDSIGPEITVQPRDTVVQCGDPSFIESALLEWYESAGGLAAVDSCSDWSTGSDISFPDVLEAYWTSSEMSCGNSGMAEVLFYAEDLCGNRTYADETVVFQTIDTLGPELIVPPVDTTFQCGSVINVQIETWIQMGGFAVVEDDCGEVLPGSFTWSASDGSSGSGNISDGPYPLAFSPQCLLELTVEFEMTDECGNSLIYEAVATIVDETPPSFAGTPDTAFYNCNDDTEILQIELSDPCSEFSVTFTDSLIAESWFNCGDFEQLILRNIEAMDDCGNISSFTQIVVVSDFEGPVFTTPPDITIDCSQATDTDLTGLPSDISDNCFSEDDILVEFEDQIINGECEPTIMRQWILTDGCANVTRDTQFIFTVDTIAPEITDPPSDLTLQCGDPDNASLFQDWKGSGGYANVELVCGQLSFFAALPGTYDLNDPSSFPGTEPDIPEPLPCDSVVGTEHFSGEVHFVYYDDCGNASFYAVQLKLVDDQPPVFAHCPDFVSVKTEPDSCEGTFHLPGFSVYDECGLSTENHTLTDTVRVTSKDPGNSSAIIEPVQLKFSNLYDPLKPVLSVDLEIELIGIDGEQPTEFFYVYDQDGELLGQTESTVSQCGNSTTVFSISDVEKINSWLSDDTIQFDLVPYYNDSLQGSFFINDICEPGLVVGFINISQAEESGLELNIYPAYKPVVSFDEFPSEGFVFEAGNHPILVEAIDCSGNKSKCEFELIVESESVPEISCPEAFEITVPDSVCEADFTFPDIEYFTDCMELGENIYSHAPNEFGYLSFFQHPDLGEYVATEKTLSLGPVQGAVNGDVTLYIQFQADVDSLFAYFEVLTIDGQTLGTIGGSANDNITTYGECQSTGLAEFTISDSLFNSLVNNGQFEIVLSPNENLPPFPGGSGAGINPCDSLIPQTQTDSVSFVRAYTSFHPVLIDIAVTGSTEANFDGLYWGEELPTHNFQLGTSTVEYTATDPWGNEATCDFSIDVLDSTAPTAICKNARIKVLPSVLDTLELSPSVVDGGSFDNCAIAEMSVEPEKFTCNDVGEEVIVTLTVFDPSGNSSQCESTVAIDQYVLEPEFSLDLCQPDTLFLFSNAPGDQALYTYEWTGPQGFTSSNPNPVIAGTGPENSGNYQVTITGFGGCTASGAVDVSISTIATPELNAVSNVVCEGDAIQLTSSTYTGNITYNWFSGSPPSGVLLGSTQQPSFSVDLPLGTHRFYVVVENPDCSSNPSATQTVEVVEDPVAVIDPSFVRICEGTQLSLSSPLGSAFEYNWTGPSGFVSDMQSPVVSQSASAQNEGIYTLVVSLGSCTSAPAQAEVVVDESPPTPIIQGTDLICVGDSIHLRVSNIPLATRFTWTMPDGSEQVSSSNQLFISNAGTELSGEWKVTADFGQCSSPESAPFVVTVEETPVLTATSNSPVCEGDSSVLTANPIPNADFEWIGPGEITFTGDTVTGILPAGTYQLTVMTQSGCSASSSVEVEVKTRPQIDAIVNLGQDCVDGNTDFCFQSFVSPPDNGNNYTYQWSGPGNFISSQANPCLFNVTEADNGYYYLQVELDGCLSERDSTLLEVRNIGRTPIVFSDKQRYCEGDEITLYSDYSPGVNIRFHWVGPAGITATTDSVLVIQEGTASEAGQYSVFVTVDQCTTSVSEEKTIEINPIPDRPSLSGGGNYCEGDSILLQTDPSTDVNYVWLGPVSLDQGFSEHLLWPAETGMSGTYRVFARKDGCVSEPSAPQTVIVNPLPPTPTISADIHTICLDEEDNFIEICIVGDSLTGGARYLYFLNDELETHVISTNSVCATLFSSQISLSGLNTLQVRTEINGCLSSFSSPLTFRADTIPDELAFAGEDFISCSSDDVQLMADFPSISEGSWSSPNPAISFDENNLPVSLAHNLDPGENRLLWSLSNGSCRNYDTDTVIVEFLDFPIARPDTAVVQPGESVLSEVLQNDFLPGPVNLDIISVSGTGSWMVVNNQAILFESSERWAGTVEITYEICLEDCPEKCDMATLYIMAGSDEDCSIPNIFTPNGDGINDAFIIPCLASDRFASNELRIYDQWGSELFRASPYENDWEGTHNGSPLNEGTYFYVLDFGDGRSSVSGFVVIKRR